MTAIESQEAQKHALYSASSVAEELDLPLYRLHSWESLYPLFSAEREDNGQRYYSEHAVHIARRIAQLLYKEGVKSHEVMGRLQQEEGALSALPQGQVDNSEGRGSSSPAEGDAAKIAELTSTIERLRQDNDHLNTHVEEFGQIALSLKELEDQNETLKASLEAARTEIRSLEEAAPQAAQNNKASTEYVAELERDNLELQEEVETLASQLRALKEQNTAKQGQEDTHIAALRDEVAELQHALSMARQSSDRSAELEAENRALHEAQKKAEEALGEQERVFRVRLDAALEQKHLEMQKEIDALAAQLASQKEENTAQREQEDTHIAALRDEAAELRRTLATARQSSDRSAELEAENRALLDAQKKAEVALSEQERASAERLESVEAERRSFVVKLEQAVVIMQSLEDENVRFKRQLKEYEAAKDEQAIAAERQKELEGEIAELKQRLVKVAEERESHARGLERIRSLEAEGVGLRQKLAAQTEQMHHHGERQKALDVLLHDMLRELDIMKKALTN